MTEMPPFPARGAMEWRNELKEYIDRARRRGDLPDGTDVDEMFNSLDHGGAWRLPSGNTYHGLPGSTTGSAVLEVIATGVANAVVQRVTDPDNSWWREAIAFRENSWVEWGEWHKTTQAPAVVGPAGIDVPEGATWFETDPLVAAVDFESGVLGEFTRIQGDSSMWTLQTERSEFPSGRALLASTGDSRSALLWDQRFPAAKDIDVLTLAAGARGNNIPYGTIVARGKEEPGGGFTGWIAGLVKLTNDPSPHVLLRQYKDNSFTSHRGLADLAVGDSDSFYVRLQTRGDLVRVKIWAFGDPEPIEWGLTVVDEAPIAGHAGMFTGGGGTSRYGYLSVDVRGGQ